MDTEGGEQGMDQVVNAWEVLRTDTGQVVCRVYGDRAQASCRVAMSLIADWPNAPPLWLRPVRLARDVPDPVT